MSTKDKLIERFLTLPRDFSFDELTRLLGGFGYTLSNKGSTSGSRVSFDKGNESLTVHRTHPGNTVGRGVLKSIKTILKTKGLV